MDLRRRSASLLSATALLVSAALAGCGGDDGGGPVESAQSDKSSAQQEQPEPNEAGVEKELEALGSVLKISLPEVESYDLEGSTLIIRFGTGSKDDVNSHCLISRSGAQGLGLPEDYKLVMAYPDGERECAS